MKLWWLPLSLLTVVPMSLQLQKTFRTSDRDRSPCQEIMCQDWTRLQSALKKYGHICRCFIVRCVYIAKVHRISHMQCIWVNRGHHKKNITTAVLQPKITRSLLKGKIHTSKQGISSKTCIIIGVFHVKRKTVAKLKSQTKERSISRTSDHHSGQNADGDVSEEKRLSKQLSGLARMLRNTFPSATWLRIIFNQKSSTICPIHPSTKYSHEHQAAEIKMSELLESAMKTASNSSNDVVLHMEKILQLLGMGLFRKEDSSVILKDHFGAKIAIDEMAAHASVQNTIMSSAIDSTHRKQDLFKTRQRRSIWKPRPTNVITHGEFKAGDDKVTLSLSLSQTVTKPLTVEDKTQESSVTKRFTTESTTDPLSSTEHLEKETSEYENLASSRKYVNTVTLTKQQMGVTTSQTETDCTTENEGSEKKTSLGSKQIRPTVGTVEEATEDGQKHQTGFSGSRLTMAETTSEKGNTLSEIRNKDEKEYAGQTKHWTALAAEKLILATSQPDILMTKESQTNNPLTPASSGGNTQIMVNEKDTGSEVTKESLIPSTLTIYSENVKVTRHETVRATETEMKTECTTEIELQTPNEKIPEQKTDKERQSEHNDLRSDDLTEYAMKHEHTVIGTDNGTEMTTEHPETECTTNIELKTPEERHSLETTTTYEEKTDKFILFNTELTVTKEPIILTTFTNDFKVTRQETSEMTTEPPVTECTTEIESETLEEKTLETTKYDEGKSEPDDLISANTESTVTEETVISSTSTKYEVDLKMTSQETVMTTELPETECTTEIELQTPVEITSLERATKTYDKTQREYNDFNSDDRATKHTKVPETPTISREYEHTATVKKHEVEMTTELPETECTTEIESETPEGRTLETTIYEERKSESDDLVSHNVEATVTNEPVTPTTSTKYVEDFIVTRHETTMTTENPETECTTETESETLEDKKPVQGTDSIHEERQSDYYLRSEGPATGDTNELVTSTSSWEHEHTVIEAKMSTDSPEREWTTETDLETPEEHHDLMSHKVESTATNQPVTQTTSAKYLDDFKVTRHETTMTTELPETESTTETESETPEERSLESDHTIYDEGKSEPDDLISANTESTVTEETEISSTSTKYKVDLKMTSQETVMTTELPETECTTEIELQTPVEITSLERATKTYDKTQTEYNDFNSDDRATKHTKVPETPTISREYEHTATVKKHEVEMTTELPETECTTEIESETPEGRTLETTIYEERKSESDDLVSHNVEATVTNEPVTPTTSTKYVEDFIVTRHETTMTTEKPETECTTETESETPEERTLERETTIYDEGKSEPDDLISANTESTVTEETVISSTSTKYEVDLKMTSQETVMTTELPETECTTEIVLQTPVEITSLERATKTYDKTQTEYNDFNSDDRATKHTKVLETPTRSREYEHTATVKKHEVEMTTEVPETECTTEIESETPEGRSLERETTAYEETQSERGDLISHNVESTFRNEPVTQTTFTKYEDFKVTRQETSMTTKLSEKESRMETESQAEEITSLKGGTTKYVKTRLEYDFTPEDLATKQTELPQTEFTTEIKSEKPEERSLEGETTAYERHSEHDNLISENIQSTVRNEALTSTSKLHNVIVSEHKFEMTTESLETECTTEIELQTPENKTPLERTDTTYEQSVIVTEHEITLVAPDTGCLTDSGSSKEKPEDTVEKTSMEIKEINSTMPVPEVESEETELSQLTDEDGCLGLIHRTISGLKRCQEKKIKINDLFSENHSIIGTQTTSRKNENLIEIEQDRKMETENFETECTTVIELQTPDNKTPVEGTYITHGESQTEPVDLTSQHLSTEDTLEPVTPTPFREHEHDVTQAGHEITLVLPDTGCSTDSGSSIENPEDVVEKTSMKTKEMKPTMAVLKVETRSQPSKQTEGLQLTDEGGCFGLIHHTISGLKRCQDKIRKMKESNFKHFSNETTNEPATQTISGKYAEDFTVIRQETFTTTESLKTKEIVLQTREDKTIMERTNTTYEETRSEYNDLGSGTLAMKHTQVPETPNRSREYEKDEKEMTTELPDTECTTEIESETPEERTSSKTETADTNALVTSPPRIQEHTVTLTEHATETTTEFSETECTTEIEILAQEDIDFEPVDLKEKIEPTIALLQLTDEDGCIGLIHRTTSGLKRCQEKMTSIMLYNTTLIPQEPSTMKYKENTTKLSLLKNELQPKKVTPTNMDKRNQMVDENDHFYYFNGKLKRNGNPALIEHDKNTSIHHNTGQS